MRLGLSPITPAVRGLMIATAAVFLAEELLGARALVAWFAMIPERVLQLELWRPVTYLFLHGGLWHLAANMFFLWMFGPPVEERLGSRRFLLLYLGAGAMGALGGLVAAFFSPPLPIVGASGAVLGVTIAFAMLYPGATVLLWFFVPVKARTLALFLAAVETYSALQYTGASGVSYAAHVGGIAGAWLILRLDLFSDRPAWERRRRHFRVVGPGEPSRRDGGLPPDHPLLRQVDAVLDKVCREGIGSLTSEEKRVLERMSDHLRRRR